MIQPDAFAELKPDPMHTISELGTILHTEISRIAKEWGVKMPSFKINFRLRRAMGRTFPWRHFDFAPELVNWPTLAIHEVVRHEYAHLLMLEYGHPMWNKHGPAWREWAEVVGCHPRATATVAERIIAASKGA